MGTITCRIDIDYGSFDTNEVRRVETGKLNGLAYRVYYSDGSGSVQGSSSNSLDLVHDDFGTNWSLRCQIDEFDDTHWCAVDRGSLRVAIWKDGSYVLAVGHDHYPHSQVAVRIDRNEPIAVREDTGFTRSQTELILEQMREGERVLTRFQEWPYERNIDASFELFGFNEAMTLLSEIYARVGESNP